MPNGLAITAILLGLLLAGFVGCRVAYPSYEWRQKITIEVETPQGPVTASSVAEVAWWAHPQILPDASPRDFSVKAEAVVLQLPDGRYLFALVRTAHLIARAVLVDLRYGEDPYLAPASRIRSFKGEVHDIQPEHYPMLVTFDDIADPGTVKLVDPADLAASFGPGFALRRMTLEITDEPITERRVRELLNWLEPYPEPPLSRSPDLFDTTLAGSITHGHFALRVE